MTMDGLSYDADVVTTYDERDKLPTADPAISAKSGCIAFVADTASANLIERLAPGLPVAPVVRRGGIAEAIASGPHPGTDRLLIVDLSASEKPRDDIDRLAEMCAPDTRVIALGEKNDVALYRDLMRMGVSDYLLTPLDGSLFVSAVEAAVAEAEDSPQTVKRDGKVIGFVGARGGVGTSSLALATATEIVRHTETKIALLDLDLAFGSLNLALDLEPVRGLREALDAPERIDSMFLSQASTVWHERLSVFASEEDPSMACGFDPASIRHLLDAMRAEFSHVVVDLPRHVLAGNPSLFGLLSEIVIVSDLSLAGLRDTNRLYGVAKEFMGGDRVHVAIGRAGANKKAELGPRDFAKPLNTRLAAEVPDLPKIAARAVQDAKPLQIVGKGTQVAREIEKLVRLFVPDIAPAKKGRRAK